MKVSPEHVIDQHATNTTSEGNINVDCSHCECLSWKSMKLPCRHIFAFRNHIGMALFDPSLCDQRWSIDYYKSKQRIFKPDNEYFTSSYSDLSVVRFQPPKKKILSQVNRLYTY